MYHSTMFKIVRSFGKLKTLKRSFSNKKVEDVKVKDVKKSLEEPEFDFEYLTNPSNLEIILENIKNRKGIGDIERLLNLYKTLSVEGNPLKKGILKKELMSEAHKIPNKTHPDIISYGELPKVIKTIPFEKQPFQPQEYATIAKNLNLGKSEGLGLLTGHRSYYFVGDLAILEDALVKYTLSKLINRGFSVVSVPDILSAEVVERCGTAVDGEKSLVYFLENSHGQNLCLSGTSEMSLAGLHSNSVYDASELPIKVAAVSRCYRAEVSNVAEEKGIYRVHQFTKVEMFGITHPDDSDRMLQELLDIEEETFQSLGLSYQILDMPMCELGPSAFRKYDIEAWLPGRDMYGEVSSCSNCASYQARRLGMKFREVGAELRHVHTVNGTACAVPRTIIALLETHQQADGTVLIPQVLQPYFNGRGKIDRQNGVPRLRMQPKGRARIKIS